jgi:hypothetical protein
MDDSVAFVIAVMIDPDAQARPPGPLAPNAEAPPPTAPPSPGWQIAPRVGVSTAFGELPGAALGATVALRLGPPSIGVELVGSFFLPQDVTVDGTSATVRFTWADAGAALCPTLARTTAVSLAGCAGVAGGALIATPTAGLQDAQKSSDFRALGTLRLRLDWRLGRLVFVAADGGADVPFERPDWTATSGSGAAIPVFRPSAVAGRAGVAVGLVFE